MGKDALAALRMINSASSQIAANRDPDHQRRRESVVRAPADGGEFVAQLHHRRPDVIEELDFNYWFESASCHARGASYDIGFCQGRIEDAVSPEFHLQSGGQLEDSAFAFYQLPLYVLFAAGVGDVFAEDDNPLVTPHLIAQCGVDELRHGLGLRGGTLAIGGGFSHG